MADTINIEEVVERVVEELDGDERVEKMVSDTLTKIANGELDIDDEDDGDEEETLTKSQVEEMIKNALGADEDDDEESEDDEDDEDPDDDDDEEESEEDEDDDDDDEEDDEEDDETEKSLSESDVERIVKRVLKGVKVTKGKRSVIKSDRPTDDAFDPEKCQKVSDIPAGWISKVASGDVPMSDYDRLPKHVRSELLAKSFRK